MRRIFPAILCLIMLLSLLGGCAGGAGDLYCLPEAPEDFYDLQTALTAVLDEGFEYLAPAGGSRQEPVQLVDLDGDGSDEAVAFFRTPDGSAVRVHIFTKTDGTYQTAAVLDPGGTAVGSVDYAEVDGQKGLELLITCQVSEAVAQALSVYRYGAEGAGPLLSAACSEYLLTDLDRDSVMEILCLGDSGKAAEAILYRLTGGNEGSTVPLSGACGDLEMIQTGMLSDGARAVLLTFAGEDDALYTDILTLAGGNLTAVQPGEVTGGIPLEGNALSSRTIRGNGVFPEDVDGDGALEVPEVRQVTPYGEGTSPQYFAVWYAVASGGDLEQRRVSYREFRENWRLYLPETWVDGVTVRESDTATESSTVSTVSFYRLTDQQKPGAELLTVYAIRGDDPQSYADGQGLTTLYSGGDTLFAVRLGPDAGDMPGGITMAQISEGFAVLPADAPKQQP